MITGKRRTMIARATVAVAVVCLSAASAPRGASAFVQVAPPSTGLTQPMSTTQGPTSTALRYMSLEQVSDFYQNFPLQSAVLTCGVKASVADTIAQVKPQIEENNSKNSPTTTTSQDELQTLSQMESSNTEPMTKKTNHIDWEARRNLAYVLYGGIFVGVMSHVEYSCVFPFLFGNEKTTAITIEKVFFDNLIAAPIMWLPPAYFIKAWVYGSDDDNNNSGKKGILAEGLEKYLVDVKENNLLWKYWAIWFPAQSVSFSVVPDHLRVAFMASISFFWFILFSTVSSQGDVEATAASSANASD